MGKCLLHEATAVMLEAKRIMERMSVDDGFRVFVLDPSIPGQTGADLLKLLLDNRTRMNVDKWTSFINNRHSVPAVLSYFPNPVKCIIRNRDSKRLLFAQNGKDGGDGFGATTGFAGAHDQDWIFERVRDRFVIRDAASGRALFAQNGKDGGDGFGATTGWAGTKDQEWFVEPASDDCHRVIRNAASGRRLFAQSSKDGLIGCGATTGWAGAKDQEWIIEVSPNW